MLDNPKRKSIPSVGLLAIAKLVIVALAFTSITFGQSETAALTGTITDPTGAVVPEARVFVTNVDTNALATTTTNDAGVYLVPSLRPGRYRVVVSKGGFKQLSLTDLVLSVQELARHDFSMEIGATSESIMVAAETEHINTSDATVSTVIDHATLANMPLNGRSFLGLITLTPGVSTVATNTSNAGQFVVNGQRSDANYFTVDGVSANTSTPIGGNTLINGTGASPSSAASGGFNNMVSVDALEEFRISTSSFAPEFGRSPGRADLSGFPQRHKRFPRRCFRIPAQHRAGRQ